MDQDPRFASNIHRCFRWAVLGTSSVSMNATYNGWGHLALLVLPIVYFWAAKAFAAHVLSFVLVWAATPIIALCLWGFGAMRGMDLQSARFTRNALMGVVVSISIVIFSDFDAVRDYVGQRWIDGYKSWGPDLLVDRSKKQWTAGTEQGRSSLKALEYIVRFAAIAFPVFTWVFANAELTRKISFQQSDFRSVVTL